MASMDDEIRRMYEDTKRGLFRNLHGTVLEIGPGTGANLPLLPDGIRWIGLEPNRAMHPFLRQKAEARGIAVDLRTGSADEMPIESGTVDCVISTLVLCSVPRMEDVLGEIWRVLVPGGEFVFIEHVVAPAWTPRWMIQKAAPFTPWRFFADGCNPGRDIQAAIENAGFSEVSCEPYGQSGPGFIVWINRTHIRGHATR